MSVRTGVRRAVLAAGGFVVVVALVWMAIVFAYPWVAPLVNSMKVWGVDAYQSSRSYLSKLSLTEFVVLVGIMLFMGDFFAIRYDVRAIRADIGSMKKELETFIRSERERRDRSL